MARKNTVKDSLTVGQHKRGSRWAGRGRAARSGRLEVVQKVLTAPKVAARRLLLDTKVAVEHRITHVTSTDVLPWLMERVTDGVARPVGFLSQGSRSVRCMWFRAGKRKH